MKRYIKIVLGIFLFLLVIGFLSSSGQETFKEEQEAGKKVGEEAESTPTSEITPTPETTPETTPTPTSSPQPTPTVKGTVAPTPSPTAKPPDPYQYFVSTGGRVASNSNVSVIENPDGTIDVIDIIQNEPDVVIESVLHARTRMWILEFMKEAYMSPYEVRYVQMSVTWLYAGVPPTQVGLGFNQARNLSEEDWGNATPYDFCKWLERVSTGKNDSNPANSTYSNNFECS